MRNLHEAVRAVYPEAMVVIDGDTVETLNVFDQVTLEPFVFDKELVKAKLAEMDAELDATQYQRDRQPEYPDLAVLADALYWSNQGDNTKLDEYYAACSAVKTKYPKP